MGPWGALACGVEIKSCEDDEDKGMGAFATRAILKGDVAGVYWGECLTLRQLTARHGSSYDWWLRDLTCMAPLERAEVSARKMRIEELIPLHETLGEPVGGAENGGNYVFALRDHPHRAKPHEVVCIDGEEWVASSRLPGLYFHPPACCLASHASSRIETRCAAVRDAAHGAAISTVRVPAHVTCKCASTRDAS